MIQIDKGVCTTCFACYEVCRGNVFDCESGANGSDVFVKHPEHCCFCGYCLSICPSDAITHDEISKQDYMKLAPVDVSPDALETLIFSRRSTRSFKETKVPVDCIKRLIDVAVHAGSGSNLQLEQIIVVQDQAFLFDLEKQVIDAFWKGGMRFFKQDGLLVRLLTKLFGKELTGAYQIYHDLIKHWKKTNDFKGRAFYNTPLLMIIHGQKANKINQANCAIAIRNIELLAETMGLSTCWSGWLIGAAGMSGKINKRLGLDRTRQIGGAVMVGYPKHRNKYKVVRNERDIKWI